MDEWGFGMASVRFICGTQELHLQLEQQVSRFLGTEDTILYSSCFDANGGVFETLFGPEDAIISDALNHASIIDGIRLSKAVRFRYANRDMAELEARLQEAAQLNDGAGADGRSSSPTASSPWTATWRRWTRSANWPGQYGALVMVDDSHAVGFIGSQRCAARRSCRRAGPGRHLHRHLRQGPGRRLRRLRRRHAARSSAMLRQTVAALPVLQLGGPGHRRRHAEGPGAGGRFGRTARRGCRTTPRCSGAGWPRKASTCWKAFTRSSR